MQLKNQLKIAGLLTVMVSAAAYANTLNYRVYAKGVRPPPSPVTPSTPTGPTTPTGPSTPPPAPLVAVARIVGSPVTLDSVQRGRDGSLTNNTATVSVFNDGNAPLQISQMAVRDNASGSASTVFSATGCVGSSVAPGTSCDITVTLTSSSAGAAPPATMTLATNDAAGSHSVPLSGSVAAAAFARIVGSPVALNSAQVDRTGAYSSNTATVSVFNDGNTALQVSQIAVRDNSTGTASSVFSATGCVGASVVPGASCNITVTMRPTAAGTVPPATMTVTTNDAAGPNSVPLSGTLTASGTFNVTSITPTTTLVAAQATMTITGNGYPATGTTVKFTKANTSNTALNGTVQSVATDGKSLTVKMPDFTAQGSGMYDVTVSAPFRSPTTAVAKLAVELPKEYAVFTAIAAQSNEYALTADSLAMVKTVGANATKTGEAMAIGYAKSSGKWYFEVGFDSIYASRANTGLAVVQQYHNQTYAFYSDLPSGGGGAGWLYGNTKARVAAGNTAGATTMPALTLQGRILGVAVDLDSSPQTVSLIDPTQGCIPISSANLAPGASWSPTIRMAYDEAKDARISANFGAIPLTCAPAGYNKGWYR